MRQNAALCSNGLTEKTCSAHKDYVSWARILSVG